MVKCGVKWIWHSTSGPPGWGQIGWAQVLLPTYIDAVYKSNSPIYSSAPNTDWQCNRGVKYWNFAFNIDFFSVLLLKDKTPPKCYKKSCHCLLLIFIVCLLYRDFFTFPLKEVLQIFPTLPAEACFREETCPILVSKEEEEGYKGGTPEVTRLQVS